MIVPQLVYGAEPQRPDRLLRPLLVFTSTFDGSLDDHLVALMEGLGNTADAVWGHCDGWSGRDWLLAHRVKTGLFVAAYQAEVEEVRDALAGREKLLALAEETQDADTETLRGRFLEEFAR